MIAKGSLVRYIGTDKRFYHGRKLMVHDRTGDSIVVFDETKIPVKDVEEVC